MQEGQKEVILCSLDRVRLAFGARLAFDARFEIPEPPYRIVFIGVNDSDSAGFVKLVDVNPK